MPPAATAPANGGVATVIATLPPPTTGMTRVTERMVAELASRGGRLTVVNLSAGGASRRRTWKIIRSWRQAQASARVLAGRLGDGNIYLALNSGIAVVLDVLLVAAARARRRQVFLHHHSFRYINTPSPILRTLYRIGGTSVTDIVLCDRMATALRHSYRRPEPRVVPNLAEPATASSPPFHPPRQGGGGPGGLGGISPHTLKLGHLANLTLDKGVGRAIAAFTAAHERGFDVELHLAGPFASPDARTAVESAQARWPGRVTYHGPLYGPNKSAFYASLDLFLYPTAYVVEAQPLVLIEALAAGVPIVSVDRGCIAGLASSAAGDAVSICSLDDISDVACATLKRLAARNPERRAADRAHVIATAEALALQAQSAFAAVAVEILTCDGSYEERSSSWQSSSRPAPGGG